VHGWGVSDTTLRTTLRRMIDDLGVDSLQLPVNGQARELAVELAGWATRTDRGAPPT
jgi:hypothetical protein